MITIPLPYIPMSYNGRMKYDTSTACWRSSPLDLHIWLGNGTGVCHQIRTTLTELDERVAHQLEYSCVVVLSIPVLHLQHETHEFLLHLGRADAREGDWKIKIVSLYIYRRILLALPMYSSAGMYFSGFPCILIRNRPSAGDFVAPAPSGTRSHFMAYPLVFSHNHSTAIKQTPNHRQVCFISRLV